MITIEMVSTVKPVEHPSLLPRQTVLNINAPA